MDELGDRFSLTIRAHEDDFIPINMDDVVEVAVGEDQARHVVWRGAVDSIAAAGDGAVTFGCQRLKP